MRINSALLSDSYKYTHWRQYPPGTEYVESYFEARDASWEVCFVGLQYILQRYLEGEFRINPADVAEAREMCAAHFGTDGLFNAEGWKHILHEHFGRIPLSIRAVPEGMVIPGYNVLMTVRNTCPKCYWVTNFFETLLVQAWYPITVASQSRAIKRDILSFLQKTGDPGLVDFKLHDFGFRGVSSVESAGIGGMAHLVNFKGTDTFWALKFIRDYYTEQMAGFSIPASEHSTITSWGKEHEVEAFRNMLEQYPDAPWMACVSDSFDIRRACLELWGNTLKAEVLERSGVLVVRPDSGQLPHTVLQVLADLGEAFGYGWNEKGYKVLNPKVRVIQGDGVNRNSIHDILQCMQAQGWSADNLAFGMGGALLQKLDRDTLKMAFKCAYAAGTKDGVPWERDVYKDPVTDPGKRSKRGQLALVKAGGTYHTQSRALTKPEDDLLVEVFRDGSVLKHWTLAEIRERAAL